MEEEKSYKDGRLKMSLKGSEWALVLRAMAQSIEEEWPGAHGKDSDIGLISPYKHWDHMIWVLHNYINRKVITGQAVEPEILTARDRIEPLLDGLDAEERKLKELGED